MGGRGTSSMSASGRGITTSAPNGLTDSQLSGAIQAARSQMDEVAERLNQLSYRIDEARMSQREGRTERVESAQRAYNEGSELYNQLRDRLGALEDEQLRRRQASQSASSRTFVNSYGEATRRNITSQSYESAQRRLNQRVESWMRGR